MGAPQPSDSPKTVSKSSSDSKPGGMQSATGASFKDGSRKSTYGQILKSSALIGGSSAANVAVGIVRAKVMALLVGTAGVGLMGIYNSIVDLSFPFAGLGLNTSGVRQIAESRASGDETRLARTVWVLRRVSLMLGLLGGLLLLVASGRVSLLTFEDTSHQAAIGLLALAVMFRVVSGSQVALVQGMRQVANLARIGVLGPLLGTCLALPIIYFLREKGIALSVLAVAAMMVLVSWWYGRKVRVKPCTLGVGEARGEVAGLLKLGVALMASALMGMGVAFAIRTFVLRTLGLDAAGLYQSAWALGGLYVGFILQAMGADFLPRLTGVATDNAECNRLVNEQALVSLLIAGPGVLATITFAPLVLAVFYTAEFHPAAGILRWFCLGMALRVFTWPMGFIVFAKGRQEVFFLSELAYTAVHVGLAWWFIRLHGLAGAGMAFFGSYIFHALMMYPVARWLSGFRWSRANGTTGLLFGGLIAAVFCGFAFLPSWVATVLGVGAAAASAVYSLRTLSGLVDTLKLPGPVRKLLVLVGVKASGDGPG